MATAHQTRDLIAQTTTGSVGLRVRRLAAPAASRRAPSASSPGAFAREIGPKVQAVSLAAMMRATGLSRPYCAMIRRGARVPHPRHWGVLGALPN